MVLASLFYPDGFSFFTTLLSDFGRSISVGGKVNPVASILFSFSMAFGAVVLFIFFWKSPNLLAHKANESGINWKLQVGRFSGIISCIGLLGIGTYRLDLDEFIHHVSGGIFFGLLGLSAFMYSLHFVSMKWKFFTLNFSNIAILIITGIFIFVITMLLDTFPFNYVGLGIVIFVVIFMIFAGFIALRKRSSIDSDSTIVTYLDFVLMVLSLYVMLMGPLMLVYTWLLKDFIAIVEMIIVFGILGWIMAINLRLMIEGYKIEG